MKESGEWAERLDRTSTDPDEIPDGRTGLMEEWSESEEGGDNQTPFICRERGKKRGERALASWRACCVLRARPGLLLGFHCAFMFYGL